jgi:hypothetical protein
MNQPTFAYTFGLVTIEMAIAIPLFSVVAFGLVAGLKRALRPRPEPPDPRELARLADFVAEFANRNPRDVPPLLDLCAATSEMQPQVA